MAAAAPGAHGGGIPSATKQSTQGTTVHGGTATTAAKPSQGKPRSLMQPQKLAAVHPFTPTMTQWRHGIKVDCGPDWAWDVIEAAVDRGPHPTACTPDAHELFRADIDYQVTAGFSKVMLWEDIRKLRPSNLKVSPVALVPQPG